MPQRIYVFPNVIGAFCSELNPPLVLTNLLGVSPNFPGFFDAGEEPMCPIYLLAACRPMSGQSLSGSV